MSIRVLHIMGEMDRGGVSICLLNFLRKINLRHFQTDILVHTDRKCALDKEIQRLGIRLIPCPHHRNPLRYARDFIYILKQYGPYDIIHSHPHYFSGFVIRLARLAGVKRLLVHSHSDTQELDLKARGFRKFYLKCMRNWIQKYATAGLACSKQAANALYGSNWEKDSRWKIIYCGVDFEIFKNIPIQKSWRKKLQIPVNTRVIGHVGRFTEAKNHTFLLKIFKEVIRRIPQTKLLLIGDGVYYKKIRAETHQLGLADAVIFGGAVSNVPEILTNAIDIFVFPSIYEGLPLALLEAQAAGLPCIISDSITEEAIVIKELIQSLPITAPVYIWADTIVNKLVKSQRTILQHQALSLMENSPFNINIAVKMLEDVYLSLINN